MYFLLVFITVDPVLSYFLLSLDYLRESFYFLLKSFFLDIELLLVAVKSHV